MAERKTVFVIEDDRVLGDIYREVLELSGLSVEWIRDGFEAQRRLREASPDLILLDLHLPNVSGIDLLDQIQNDDRLKHSQVAVLTADGLSFKEVQNRVALAYMKPITLEELMNIPQRLGFTDQNGR